jgi:4-hydroxyphenylpyruvate dioxygenase
VPSLEITTLCSTALLLHKQRFKHLQFYLEYLTVHCCSKLLLVFTMAPAAISPPSSPRPSAASPSDVSSYQGYHHVHWYVGNAKQAASFYVSRMGFERVAYRGLETGSRTTASHVIRNGNVTFILTSPLRCLEQGSRFSKEDEQLLREIHEHQERHGDAVKGTP